MTSKKLGALLRSVPPAVAAETLAEAPVAAAPELAPPQPERRAARVPQPSAAEAEVPLQVLIPESVRKQLAFRAVEEGQSLRQLVLRAIRSLGITVTDAQIKGKRGRRSA
jgi:hypothetical protein